MKENYIFGLTRKLISECETLRSGWVIDCTGDNIKAGTPCIVIKEQNTPLDMSVHDESRKAPHRIVLLPMSSGTANSPRKVLDNRSNINNLALRIGQETNFFDTIKTLEVDRLDLGKIEHVIDFTRDSGPVTLLINDNTNGVISKDLFDLSRLLDKKFKIACNFQYTHPGRPSLMPGDRGLFALTFVDVKQCLPIFDPKNVDGVMVHGAAIYTASSEHKDKLIAACEFSFLYSNFEQNILEIDGQQTTNIISKLENIQKVISDAKNYFGDIGKFLKDTKTDKDINENPWDVIKTIESGLSYQQTIEEIQDLKTVSINIPRASNTSGTSITSTTAINW